MKQIKIPILAFAILLCATLTLGAAATADANAALTKAREAFESAGSIYTELSSSIDDEVAAADDEEGEFDFDEAGLLLGELDGYAKQLDGLLGGLSGLPKGLDDSVGKTVAAVCEYLTMLKNITSDFSELIAYSMRIVEAAMVFEEMDEEVSSYEALADQIYTSAYNAIELMNQTEPPPYLAISHGDFLARLQEFQDFALDFYIATNMGDPLRIYSCLYRMGRIETMFTICGNNLNSDLELQLLQAERRLNGPVATLHDELSANFALLLGQQER